MKKIIGLFHDTMQQKDIELYIRLRTAWESVLSTGVFNSTYNQVAFSSYHWKLNLCNKINSTILVLKDVERNRQCCL